MHRVVVRQQRDRADDQGRVVRQVHGPRRLRQALQEVARFIPNNLLLIETDSPYLAPQGFRGQKNEPANIVHTAKFVAHLRGMSIEDLGIITTDNVKRLFHGVS